MAAIDIHALADLLGQILTPFLPALIGGAGSIGGSVLEGFGKKIGETGWQSVTRLWDKLRPQVDAHPESAHRLQEAISAPGDARSASLISGELEKLLQAMPADELIEIRELVSQISIQVRSVTATGDRSIAIGGDVSNSSIGTGDRKDSHG